MTKPEKLYNVWIEDIIFGKASTDVLGEHVPASNHTIQEISGIDVLSGTHQQPNEPPIKHQRSDLIDQYLADDSVYLTQEDFTISIAEGQTRALRFTSVWEKKGDQWFLRQANAFEPDSLSNPAEPLPLDELRKRNDELQELINGKSRELEIEIGLDRLRARSMAMNRSQEIQEVCILLYEELQKLGVDSDSVQIEIIRNDIKGFCVWVANEFEPYGSDLILEPVGDGIVEDFVNARKNGAEEFFFSKDKATKDHYYEKAFQQEGLGSMPQGKKDLIWAGDYITAYAVWKNRTGLHLVAFDKPDFKPEDKKILKRFAVVFDQFYTRFLDLRKAEDQARKAEVELALERVRAKSMAMQKSDELQSVVNVTFEELTKLNVQANILHIGTNITNEGLYLWASEQDAYKYSKSLWIPRVDHPFLNNAMKAWDDGLTYHAEYFDKETKDKGYQFLFDHTEIGEISAERKNELLAAPSIHRSSIFFKDVDAFFSILNYQDRPFDEEEINVFKRFGGVFEQAYQRFLDLQKAEEQAREAQIESSLERVRAQAMAMSQPSDLVKVTQTLIQEISRLGIKGITGAAFMLVDDQDIVTMWDISDPGNMGFTRDHKSVYDPTQFKMLGEFWRKWKEGINYFVIKYDLEKNKKGLEEWKLVDEENYKSLKRAIEQNKLKTQWNPYASFSRGLLTLDMMNEPDADTGTIVTKMAQTFDLAYQRFDDLQKAEEQAKEAKKQASLDRIRAEIASMRNQKDLERITPLIWSELGTLEVPFFRCGIFIIEASNQKVQVYLSTPGGESIAAITFDYYSNQIVDDAVDYWKQQEIYKTEWTREEFVAWSKDLLDQGLIPNVKSYQHDEHPPENLHLQFFPFKQGMLYIGSDHYLGEEHMQLVVDMAHDFSIAYARYEDFVRLEKAKYMTETAYGELKSTQTQLIHAEKMASLGELTAGIAHEIQNPLNFVNNFSELNIELVQELQEAINENDTEEVVDLLGDLKTNEEKIIHHGKRAEDIVKSMLQHSRAGDGKKEHININSLADEYLRLSYHGLRAKDKSFNADFKCHLDQALPKVEVVPQDIGRVLLNLINNAFHAVTEKATTMAGNGYNPAVEVHTQLKDNSVKISVKDNGSGIPEEIREKIFQPFFTTKETGEGTGLGLSLSFDIITKGHDGTLEVYSTEGEGSEFIISLPIK